MIAKRVYEYLNFERGRDPKYAMGIGQVQKLAESIWNFMNKTHGVPWVDEKRTEAGLFMSVHTRSTAIITVFENVKKYIGTSYFKWSDNFTAIPNVNFCIKPEFESLFSEAISIAKKMDESVNFQRDGNPHKTLRIGKYRSEPRTFIDDGDTITIDVIDNSFIIANMKVELEFRDDPDIGESAKVTVDGQPNDFMVFKIVPFDYEFKSQGEYSKPGFTSYGYPIAKDSQHLKELKELHSYWTVINGDFSRENKDPFIAVAKLVLYTF
jgi:hypothetical protein